MAFQLFSPLFTVLTRDQLVEQKESFLSAAERHLDLAYASLREVESFMANPAFTGDALAVLAERWQALSIDIRETEAEDTSLRYWLADHAPTYVQNLMPAELRG